MKADELRIFIDVLEDVATYCKKNIDEKKFVESVVAIKGVFKEAGLHVIL